MRAAATVRSPDLYKGVVSPTRYGSDDTTYVRAGLYLSGPGLVEDWGCGTTYARRFIGAPYWGVDGVRSKFNDEQADLAAPRPAPAPKILMRHVLEHNWNWRDILENLLNSFTDRAALVLFLQPGPVDKNVSGSDLSDTSEWPGLELCEPDLNALLDSHPEINVWVEDLTTATAPQNFERIYWLSK
jgi:hypothetical protein